MPEVLAIEAACFDTPWTEAEFSRMRRQQGCVGVVVEDGDEIVGYMLYALHKTRIHVENFAVSPGRWREGIGRQMVAMLVSKLSAQRRTRITLEVRETNLAAQLFFQAAGFRAVSVLRDTYEGTREDAYLMQYRLPADAPSWKGVNRIAEMMGKELI